MSNFFGALDSDDEEPTKIQTTKKVTAAKGAAPAAVVANKVDANRLTGADKKNRDQKRHGATRGNKSDAPAAKDGKREFDRRSGTGISGGQSKQGRGKFSFGSPEEEAQRATKDPASAEVEIDVVEDDEPVEAAEPVVPTKSMEEFMAERAQKKAAVAALAGGAKKERKVEAIATTAKAELEVDALLGDDRALRVGASKGPSTRKQQSVKVDVKYGFRSEVPDEDRPRREFNSDRPPRAPREGGERTDRPPRAPRKDGDGKDRPRRENNRDGARPQNGAGANKPREQRKGSSVNLKDADAFPAL